MLRFSIRSVLGVASVVVFTAAAGAQQPDVSLSPFVSFLPAGTAGPMTGLSLMFSGGPLALRAGGHIALQDRAPVSSSAAGVTMRPWGADADAVAYLESYSYRDRVAFTPYVFAGVSTGAVDSGTARVTRQGWSYGGGMALPVVSAIGLFGEWRWRMSRYVMPNSDGAPPATSEVRVGMTFHVGSGGPSGHAVPFIVPGDSGFVVSPNGGFTSYGSTSPSGSAMRLLSTASDYIGTPYRRGGSSPSSGFDASGFVRFIFARLGVVLPRTSRDQARVGEGVRTDLRVIAPGDLLLFQDDGGINHVAIYAGRGRIVHSSETGGGVRYDDLDSDRGRWFMAHLVAARRVTPDVRGLMLDLARGYASDETNGSDGPDHAPRASSMRRRP